MNGPTNAAIVVGFDGSYPARQALYWAIDEGRRRSIPVHVTHVIQAPSAVVHGVSAGLTDEQEKVARKEIEECVAANGGSGVEVSILEGSPAGCLCELSHDAAMLVVGARGQGGFTGLQVGSVTFSVAAHAACPVVVVRGQERPWGSRLPIVAGIDGVQAGAQVVEFALAEACTRECPVLALHAWRPALAGVDRSQAQADERRVLEEVIAAERRQCPSVEMWAQLDEGEPTEVLIRASKSAQLVVIGARGTGGFGGLLLGSVSQQLLHHAHCPVAIVR